MPPRSIGVPGTLFLYPTTVRIVAGKFERQHPRVPTEGKTLYSSEDRVSTLAQVSGERGRLYFKRQQLLELGVVAEQFLTEVIHRRRRTWKGDVRASVRRSRRVRTHGARRRDECRRRSRALRSRVGRRDRERACCVISTTDRPQTDALRSPRIVRKGLEGVLTPLSGDSGATNGSDKISLTSPPLPGEVREICNQVAAARRATRRACRSSFDRRDLRARRASLREVAS